MPIWPWRRQPGTKAPQPTIREPRSTYGTEQNAPTTDANTDSALQDARETPQRDQHHAAMYAYFGTHTFAPIQQPTHILDVGCGTGAWVEAMHSAFPTAEITGMDISAPGADNGQDQLAGYTFVTGNILEPFPFPEASFDYVHMRFLFTVIPVQMWPVVVEELVRVTKRGGWIELVEAYLPRDGGPALAQLEAWANQLFALSDIDASYAHQIAYFLHEAGATHIDLREEALPVGDTGGNQGQLMVKVLIMAYRQALTAMGQTLLLQQARIEETLQAAELEIASGRYSVIIPIYIACGQKV